MILDLMLNSPLLIEGRTIRNLLGESSSLAIRCDLGLFSMHPFICLGLDAKTTFHIKYFKFLPFKLHIDEHSNSSYWIPYISIGNTCKNFFVLSMVVISFIFTTCIVDPAPRLYTGGYSSALPQTCPQNTGNKRPVLLHFCFF